MVSVKTADGRSLFVPASTVAVIEMASRPIVKGARVRIIAGDKDGEVGEVLWVDPNGESDRVEVRFLPPNHGSAWLTLGEIQLDV